MYSTPTSASQRPDSDILFRTSSVPVTCGILWALRIISQIVGGLDVWEKTCWVWFDLSWARMQLLDVKFLHPLGWALRAVRRRSSELRAQLLFKHTKLGFHQQIMATKNGHQHCWTIMLSRHVEPAWWGNMMPPKQWKWQKHVSIYFIFGRLPHGPFPQLFNCFSILSGENIVLRMDFLNILTLIDLNWYELSTNCEIYGTMMYVILSKNNRDVRQLSMQSLSWSGADSVPMFVWTTLNIVPVCVHRA
jgi:hypothetical protein